ncbi:hypothetical protein LguiA_018767 [Lonicera macranthoides]
MGIRAGVILLILVAALAMVVESSSFKFKNTDWEMASTRTCNGPVGSCINQVEEMMMDSDSNRRSLGRVRFISYDAMRANNVPCNQRGVAYYNCGVSNRANPYHRACTAATSCARVR